MDEASAGTENGLTEKNLIEAVSQALLASSKAFME
jgi:hypothetical protein